MLTEPRSERGEHLRSIGVTALCALFGVGAAMLSASEVGLTADAASDSLALVFVLVAILVLYGLIKLTGIYSDEEFGIKHYLFMSFMIFAFWFVTWGILLTETAPT